VDLERTVEADASVHASCGWSLLPPNRHRPPWRLRLRVAFQRPVHCELTVGFGVRAHASDPLRATLSLLLAANRLVFALDGPVDSEQPLVWIAAPVVREPVLELLTAVGL